MSTTHPTTIKTVAKREMRPTKAARPAGKTPVATQKPFSVRGFTSMLLVLCMFMMLASGLALYLAPRGRVANSTAWTALLLSRQQWAAVHINASILFGAAAATHVALNWSRLVGYMKKRAKPSVNMKRELASALAVAGVILAGTILELPPISIPPAFKYELRDVWEQRTEPTTARQTSRAMNQPTPKQVSHSSIPENNRH